MTGGQPEPSGLACAAFLKAAKESDMGTVIKQQDEIEVYVSEANCVAIMQINSHGEESTVYFWPEHAEAIMAAIEAAAIRAEKAAKWVDDAGQEAP